MLVGRSGYEAIRKLTILFLRHGYDRGITHRVKVIPAFFDVFYDDRISDCSLNRASSGAYQQIKRRWPTRHESGLDFSSAESRRFQEEPPPVTSIYLHNVVAWVHVFPFKVAEAVHGGVRPKKFRRHEKACIFRQLGLAQVCGGLGEIPRRASLATQMAGESEVSHGSKIHSIH